MCITLSTITFSNAKSVKEFFWRQPVTFCKDRWLKPSIWLFSWWLEISPGYVYSLDKVQLKMHPGLNNLCNNDLKTPNTTLHCMQVSQQDEALLGLIPSYPLLMHRLPTRHFHLYSTITALGSIHYFISICISIWPQGLSIHLVLSALISSQREYCQKKTRQRTHRFLSAAALSWIPERSLPYPSPVKHPSSLCSFPRQHHFTNSSKCRYPNYHRWGETEQEAQLQAQGYASGHKQATRNIWLIDDRRSQTFRVT